MRLRELSFARFAAGYETQVPLSPLVLLFGANSAGKTTILELLAQALGERSATDQARSASPWHAMGDEDAGVLVELDALEVPDSPDRQLLLDALLANNPPLNEDEALDLWEQDQNRPDLESELAKLRERLELELNWDFITEDNDVVPPGPEVIARLVNILTRTLWVRFIGGFVTLITRPTLLEQDRVLLELLLTADGSWSHVAGFLLNYGEGEITDRLECPNALLPVIWLLSDEEPSAKLVREALNGLLTWVFERGRAAPKTGTHVYQDHWPYDTLVQSSYETKRHREAHPTLFSHPQLKRDSWCVQGEPRLLPGVQFLATTLSARANSLIPDFVRDQGTINIEVLQPEFWPGIPDRVLVTFKEKNTESAIDCEVLGAGVRRWVRAAIRLACAELTTSSRLLEGADVTTKEGRAEIIRTLREAAHATKAFARFRFERPASLGVILVDEPESHLHPKAVRSVARFLEDLSHRANSVVVATHHPILFDPGRLPTAQRLTVLREGRDRLVRPVKDASLELLKKETGLTEADLFLFTRLALFVEGPQDKQVLEAFFGEELRDAGVFVIPFHGTRNALALVDAEVFWSLQIPWAVLTDNTSLNRGNRTIVTPEEKAILRLLTEARVSGRPLDERAQFGLDKPDILYYLDEGICRQKEPAFPGWAATWRRSGATTGSEWKQWLRSNYPKLPLSRVGVRQIAEAGKRSGRIDPELKGKVAQIIEYANTSGG